LSSQSFAQNLDEKIKEAEMKLDKLVNAFLDGSIEKETYLVKKDELIKTKTDLNKRKSDFGRKGNNWIEPLRDWIKTAHHAEKLALSNDFYEIKSLTEKIGTNRRLLSRKIEFEFVRPYDLIPKYRAFCEARPAPASPCGINSGGASEQPNAPQFSKRLDWSQLLNEARTFFERKSDWLPRFARQEQKLFRSGGAGRKGGWGERNSRPAFAFAASFFAAAIFRISFCEMRRQKGSCVCPALPCAHNRFTPFILTF